MEKSPRYLLIKHLSDGVVMQVYLSVCIRKIFFHVGECEFNSWNRSNLLTVSSDVFVKHLTGFSMMITTAF